MNSLWRILARIDATVPAWIQIVICGYLGIVIGLQAIDRMRERRGMLLVAIFFAVAGLCILRAVTLLLALMSGGP